MTTPILVGVFIIAGLVVYAVGIMEEDLVFATIGSVMLAVGSVLHG